MSREVHDQQEACEVMAFAGRPDEQDKVYQAAGHPNDQQTNPGFFGDRVAGGQGLGGRIH